MCSRQQECLRCPCAQQAGAPCAGKGGLAGAGILSLGSPGRRGLQGAGVDTQPKGRACSLWPKGGAEARRPGCAGALVSWQLLRNIDGPLVLVSPTAECRVESCRELCAFLLGSGLGWPLRRTGEPAVSPSEHFSPLAPQPSATQPASLQCPSPPPQCAQVRRQLGDLGLQPGKGGACSCVCAAAENRCSCGGRRVPGAH